MMKCGDRIVTKDWSGTYVLVIIAQCDDRFLMVSHRAGDPRNGYMLSGWQAVLRELVAVTVPAALTERQLTAEAAPGGTYASIPLTYPLSVKGLASVLGAPASEVRDQLNDLAVQVDS